MRKINCMKGITLISLIITIVVLIILASIAIYLSIGNNGIFVRSKEAKEITNKQEATDIINLKITTAQMNKYAEKQEMPTLKELSLTLGSDNEIEYVTQVSQIGSNKYEVGENPSSIFTKLIKYPYEFEINSSLQLASIDRIKISTSESKESNLFDYSNSNEKVVGTWYNGKTMYEISISITIPTTSIEGTLSENNIDLSNYNIDECLIYQGYIKTLDYCITLPSYIQTNGNKIRLLYDNKNKTLNISNDTVSYSGGKGYITLHYTKKDIS